MDITHVQLTSATVNHRHPLSLTVPQVILQQLGAGRFRAMTGAHAFVARGDKALSFKLPSTPHFVRDGINYVRITLNDLDLYDIEFGRAWGRKYSVKRTLSGIYADDLQHVFRDVTGLDTHL